MAAPTAAFIIEGLPDLRRAFYRLIGVAPGDRMLEIYDSEPGETVHYYIQHGLWNAQYFVITNTTANRWVKQSAPLTFTLDSASNEKYAELPDDFIRAAGDEQRSALWVPGQPGRWGTMMRFEDRHYKHSHRGYYLQNDRIWMHRNSAPPAGLVMDYYYQHPVLDDDSDPIDFPIEDRPLIAVEAAYLAMMEAWAPLDDLDTKQRIAGAWDYWRGVVASRSRLTKRPDPQRARPPKYGTRFFTS
jgi:hypothetical protein